MEGIGGFIAKLLEGRDVTYTPSPVNKHPNKLPMLNNNMPASTLPFKEAAFYNRDRMDAYKTHSFMQPPNLALRDIKATEFPIYFGRPLTQTKPPLGTERIIGDLRKGCDFFDEKEQTFKYLAGKHIRNGQVNWEKGPSGNRRHGKLFHPMGPHILLPVESIPEVDNRQQYRGW